MKKLIAATVLVAAAGLVGGLTPATATAVSGSAAQEQSVRNGPSNVHWTSCASATLQKRNAQCAMVDVPLDYSHPSGRKISLAISRIKHTVRDSKYQGVMLVNPGGPGGSGLIYSILGEFVPNGAGSYYDWIGFDPRGVGSSRPAVSCDPKYFGFHRPSYVPTSRSIQRRWLAKVKDYVEDCGERNGPILQHLTTIDSAKDVDSIRKALGAKQINYYGFSYGTYLGQVYGTLFGHRVRRMVLDSSVNPERIWYLANLDQDIAFNRNINIWFGWVARYNSVYHLGKTERAVRDLWYSTLRRLGQHPADGKIGASEWTDIFLLAGYSQATWTDLADTFAGYIHKHNVASLEQHYLDVNGYGNDNGYAVYLGVECTDVQWPRSWSKWQRDNWKTYAKAPFETWGNAWFNAPCLYWPAKAHKPIEIDGEDVQSVLLIDETLDAATPYSGSLEVRERFPHSSLIAVPGGTTHANSLAGNACLDDQIAAYLAHGTLPRRVSGDRADTTCAPLPRPVPAGATAPAAVADHGNSLTLIGRTALSPAAFMAFARP
jgi:pimeloyl-ACP methyl ester carboxylesterase